MSGNTGRSLSLSVKRRVQKGWDRGKCGFYLIESGERLDERNRGGIVGYFVFSLSLPNKKMDLTVDSDGLVHWTGFSNFSRADQQTLHQYPALIPE